MCVINNCCSPQTKPTSGRSNCTYKRHQHLARRSPDMAAIIRRLVSSLLCFVVIANSLNALPVSPKPARFSDLLEPPPPIADADDAGESLDTAEGAIDRLFAVYERQFGPDWSRAAQHADLAHVINARHADLVANAGADSAANVQRSREQHHRLAYGAPGLGVRQRRQSVAVEERDAVVRSNPVGHSVDPDAERSTLLTAVVQYDVDNSEASNHHRRHRRQLLDLTDAQLDARDRPFHAPTLPPAFTRTNTLRYRYAHPRPGDHLQSRQELADTVLLTNLFAYLHLFTGRHYETAPALRPIADDFVARKRRMDEHGAWTSPDLLDYMASATYLNITTVDNDPDADATRLPEAMLSGDCAYDRRRLDRLTYSRRWAAELQRRQAAAERLTAEQSAWRARHAADIDWLRVAVGGGRQRLVETRLKANNWRVADVEQSVVVIDRRDELDVAAAADVTTTVEPEPAFMRETTPDWRSPDAGTDVADDDRDALQPWWLMSAEERADTEFAAYLHAIIATYNMGPIRAFFFVEPCTDDGVEGSGSDSSSSSPSVMSKRSLKRSIRSLDSTDKTSADVAEAKLDSIRVAEASPSTPIEIVAVMASSEAPVSRNELLQSDSLLPAQSDAAAAANANVVAYAPVEERVLSDNRAERTSSAADLSDLQPIVTTDVRLEAARSSTTASTAAAASSGDQVEGSGAAEDVGSSIGSSVAANAVAIIGADDNSVESAEQATVVHNNAIGKDADSAEIADEAEANDSNTAAEAGRSGSDSDSDEDDERNGRAGLTDLLQSVAEAVHLSGDLENGMRTFRGAVAESAAFRQARSRPAATVATVALAADAAAAVGGGRGATAATVDSAVPDARQGRVDARPTDYGGLALGYAGAVMGLGVALVVGAWLAYERVQDARHVLVIGNV